MSLLIIYTVKNGDTLFAIARQYGTTVDRLAYDNQIENPQNLVIGQALVIGVDRITHQVSRGDSLYQIAQNYRTTIPDILALNPEITDRNLIYPGQMIHIAAPRSQNLRGIDVNGYTISISDATLRDTLPFLTYISPFSYQVDIEGNLTAPNDQSVIERSRDQQVAALMCVTNTIAGGGFSSEIAHAVLTNQTVQDRFIQNVMQVLKARNYYGLSIDFEYIFPYDRESYNQFLRRIAPILHQDGFILVTAIAPKISAGQAGTLYEAHDYPVHGEVCDLVIIMTYEWGYLYGPPMAVAPIGPVRQVLDYAVSAIPPGKILMGMPNYGYDWTLPFVRGSSARVLTSIGAVSLAASVGAEIQFDSVSQAPFFNYYDAEGRRHEVWFEDARSYDARLRLVDEYQLGGVSFWTVDHLFRPGYLVMQNINSINKLL